MCKSTDISLRCVLWHSHKNYEVQPGSENNARVFSTCDDTKNSLGSTRSRMRVATKSATKIETREREVTSHAPHEKNFNRKRDSNEFFGKQHGNNIQRL